MFISASQNSERVVTGWTGTITPFSMGLPEGADRVSPIANAAVDLVKRRMGVYTE
jgi:hypothetical protein